MVVRITSTAKEEKIDEFVNAFTALQHQLERRIHVTSAFVSSQILGEFSSVARLSLSWTFRRNEYVQPSKTFRNGRIAHEIRPTDQDGRVRPELPEVLEAADRLRRDVAYRGRPECRSGDRIRVEDELRS